MRLRKKTIVPVAVIALSAVAVMGASLPRLGSMGAMGRGTGAFEVPLTVGGEGAEPGRLRRPSGMTVDPSGRIYVADTLNHRVQIFSADGKPLAVLGLGGVAGSDLHLPEDVAISPSGSVYVADTSNNRIQIYTPDGIYLGSIPDGPESSVSLASPSGVTFDGEGYLYVVNSDNGLIMKFSPRGRLLRSWGGVGSVEGRFVNPSRIAVDREGNMWVTDTGNHRVQVLSPGGDYLTRVGRAGSGLGELKSPLGIAIDGEGNVFVADSGNGRVQKFDSKGRPLALLGRRGKDLGQFIYPNGLALDAAGNLYVTDSLAHRIQKLTFKPARVLLEQGWVSYEKKNYQVALSLWNRSLKIDPRLAETMYAIGTYHLETGRSSQAIEWFKKALEIDPSYREAKRSLSRAYLKQYLPLITIAGAILTLLIIYFLRRQNKINALNMRAKQLREEGETRETIAAYEKLLELDRNNLEVCKVLSELYQSEGMEDQSRRVNRTIARLEPGNVLALSQIGKNQLNEGKFSRSADTWKKVIRVSPHNSDAYFYLGMAEAQGTGESEAVKHFLKAFDLEEETLQGLINSADSCIKRKEMARAALKLKAAQSMEPDNRKIEKMIERMGERYEQELVSMARKGLDSGFEVALLAWEQELKDRPSFNAARSAFRAARVKAGELLFDEAKREVGEGHQQAALPMLERVLKLQPGKDDAIELYREVRIDIAFKKGYRCYKDEDYSRAIDCFQQVLSIDPEHEDARKYLRYAHQCMEGGFRARFKHLDL